MRKTILSFLIIIIINICGYTWGFFAHRRINHLAVFTLPTEMVSFYKKHILYITENAVNPDRRRYAVEGEAPRHYIDIDHFGKDAIYTMPRRWEDAVAKYTEDTLMAYGIVPWHINTVKYWLTNAFRDKDVNRILRISADLGHYIADANVPLHTTENYNGQFTGQYGIHAFWESRLTELYSDEYDFFVGQASYINDPLETAWSAVTQAHLALDSVFSFERQLNQKFSGDKKYSFEDRLNRTTRVYSKAYSKAYHQMLNNQVERQMRRAVKMTGDFWYTCWVDAGQPNLDELTGNELTEDEINKQKEEEEKWKKGKLKARKHER
ncbi:MAG: S1/P1 Nuclease [Cytophagales bacterium]|nr:S1/P1 Nuclease [Cytophagales bacterium]